jgi:hypothetical protein
MGWRVPLLLSALLVIVGLMIRVRILETPAFAKVKEASSEHTQPIIEVLRTYPKQVLLAMGARFGENGAFYIYSVFVLTYATQREDAAAGGADRDVDRCGLELIAIPFFGAMSDRFGRRPMYLFGRHRHGPVGIRCSACSTPRRLRSSCSRSSSRSSSLTRQMGRSGVLLRSSSAEVRTRRSLGAQLAAGPSRAERPFIATLLLARYGTNALSLYLIFPMAAVTIVAVLLASETHRDHID